MQNNRRKKNYRRACYGISIFSDEKQHYFVETVYYSKPAETAKWLSGLHVRIDADIYELGQGDYIERQLSMD